MYQSVVNAKCIILYNANIFLSLNHFPRRNNICWMQKANKCVSKKYVAIKIGTYTVYISLVVPVKINFKSRTSEKARNSKTLLTTPRHTKPGILARQHCNFWNNDIRVLSELKFFKCCKKVPAIYTKHLKYNNREGSMNVFVGLKMESIFNLKLCVRL